VHAHVERLVSVVKMVTVLAGVLPKRSILLCVFFFCGQKDLVYSISARKCFLFTAGSACRVKRFAAVANV
jgi:hypothetical protein